MTLDHPSVEITVQASDAFSVNSIHADGTVRQLTPQEVARFTSHANLSRSYLEKFNASHTLPETISLSIVSSIPSSIGLASSAAIFCCVAKAYAEFIKEDIQLTDEQISVLARLGSGSAARGVFGGFSAMILHDEEIGGAHAIQIADEHHWDLHDIIIAPSIDPKKFGSTEGHILASSSPFFAHRLERLPYRQAECIDAIHNKDFEKLQSVTEEDCMDMHHVMRTSNSPLHYLSEDTYMIVDDIITLRKEHHLPVLFTMDAGPTVHLFCTEEALPKVRAYAKEQEAHGRIIFEAKAGSGAKIID